MSRYGQVTFEVDISVENAEVQSLMSLVQIQHTCLITVVSLGLGLVFLLSTKCTSVVCMCVKVEACGGERSKKKNEQEKWNPCLRVCIYW